MTPELSPNLNTEPWDVIVIGAGPAGSNAALVLAKEGHRVALIDWREFPRDKICGDGLIADSINHLKSIGLYDEIANQAHTINTISIFGPSRDQVTIHATCLTLRRFALDHTLQKAAISAGAQFYSGKINRVEINPDTTVTAHFMDKRPAFVAKYAIIATGADISLLRPHGMVDDIKPGAVAIRGYLKSTVTIAEMVLSFDKSLLPGYAWIFPMGNGEYNIGCGIKNETKKGSPPPDLRKMLDEFMVNFPIANQLLKNGEWISPIRGSVLRLGLTGITPHKGPIIAVGESIATTFPFTGEGIGKAMETAVIGAKLVHQSLREGKSYLAHYPKALSPLKDKYKGYEMAQKWGAYSFILDLIIRKAKKHQRIRNSIAGLLNETINPGKLFTFKKLLKVMFTR